QIPEGSGCGSRTRFSHRLQSPHTSGWGVAVSVLVHIHRHALSFDDTFHGDARRVFYVDLEIAEVTTKREDSPRKTEEPVDVIQFMDVGEDDAAAQSRLRGVGLPVIFVRMRSR